MATETDRKRRILNLNYDYNGKPKVEISRCNLCGEKRFIILAHKDRYGFPAQAYACENCGLVFLNPVMTPEAYQEFYGNIYRPLVSAYHGRLIDADTIQSEQYEYAVETAEFIMPCMREAQAETLLDIGGSTGVVAYYLAKQFNLTATVLDPAPLEIVKAQKMGIETITSMLEDYDPEGRRFDIVFLCQTIDHLLDAAGAFNKIRALVKPSGMLYLDIVDFRAAYLRNWSVEEAIKIDHPFCFTETTIEAYLISFGFSVLRKSYAVDPRLIKYICQSHDSNSRLSVPTNKVDQMLTEIRMVQNTKRG